MSALGSPQWQFPDPDTIDGDVAGIGADLEPPTLVHAYREGIFPWPHGPGPLPWFSPDPRALIPLGCVRVSRSLRKRLRRSGWEATVDEAFPGVIRACATVPRTGEGAGTWITPEMVVAYERVHALGWAHSVEIWEGGVLVGGLYGMLLGGVFTGESMFHLATDASKVALVELEARLAEAGAVVIDVQLPTPHLDTMGASPVPRREFLRLLRAHRDDDVKIPTDRRLVSRL